MRESRFSDEQVVAILREADRDPIAAVARRHGVSERTIYTWRKRIHVTATSRALSPGKPKSGAGNAKTRGLRGFLIV